MKRALLGIVCFLPLTGLLGFALAIIGFLARAFAKNDRLADVLQPAGSTLFVIGFLSTIPAVIVSLVWLSRSAVPQEKRTLWLLAIILGNVITLPVFWWVVVRRSAA